MKYYETVTFSLVPKDCGRVLDFGCGDGSFCKKLTKRANEIYGCDIDRGLIGKAKRTVKGVKFNLLGPKDKTPYKNNYFDCVFMMGVLEHVVDEKETLREVERILKPNGSLFIFGINKNSFGFLDAGNLKFVFPRIHKFLYTFLLRKDIYQREFIKKRKEGMFGDITLGKKWHSHYSTKDLTQLFDGKFRIQVVRHFGLFIPILLPLKYIYDFKFKKINRFLEKLIYLDQKIISPLHSYLFVVKCVKI